MAASSAVAQVLRLFTILLRVSRRRPCERMGRQELADACECSVRTIGRDLKMLENARIPLIYDPEQHAFLLPDKGWAITTAPLTPGDAVALALALSLLSGSSSPLALTTQIGSALEKVTASLPPALQQQMEEVAAVLHQPGGLARDYSRAPVTLLARAAQRQQTVEMLYNSLSGGKCERRLVDPYRLDQRDGRYWEMQAWCHSGHKVKTFAFDRVLEARITEETFVAREWDDSDKGVIGGIRGGEWIEVAVRFDAVVAPWAKDRNWPFEAAWETQADGSLLLRAQVRGCEGIVRELLAWRRHATVLGGPRLRERMREEVQAMYALYADDKKD